MKPIKTRILLIDDDSDAREILKILLEIQGYEVYTKSSAKSALTFLENLQPEVVISDLHMPEVDGYEAAALIRRQPWGKQLLLIVLSGYASVEVEAKAQQAGFDYQLKKPLDTILLERIIRQHMSA